MKRVSALLLAAALCLCLFGCSSRGRANLAGKIINTDPTMFRDLAVTILETGQAPEDAAFSGVERIEYLEPGWAAFYTGGWGGGASAGYCGFYYSPENVPLGFQGAEMTLTADGEEKWTWQGVPDGQGGGDNEYYTSRIHYGWVQQNWFYFEMSF